MPIKDIPGVGRVQFPDNMSEEEINAAIRANQTSESVFNPKVQYSAPAETMRTIAGGPTFGFQENIEAALRTGSMSSPEYIEQRDVLRAKQKAFREDYPVIGTVSDIGGQLVGPLASLKLLGKAPIAVQEAVTGTTLPGQIGRAVTAGGVTGALSSAGQADSDLGKAAIYGGVFGASLGGVAPFVVNGAGTVIRNALNAFGIGDQQTAASKILAANLKRDNLTIDEAQATLDELRRIGVPNPVIADLGKSMRDLAQSSYFVPSKAKGATEAFLEGRLIDQPSDIVKGIAEKANLNPNVNGYEYLNSLVQNQRAAASSKYPQAYSKALDARDFRKYVDRPVFQQAYEEAKKRAAVRGQILPDLEQIRNAQFVPTDILHQIKIGLDGIIESQTDVAGKVTGYGREIISVKNEFNDLIKQKNPIYAKANAEFADSQRIQDSFVFGTKYQSLDPMAALDKLKKMNPAEKESFRLGMMSDINRRASEFKGGDFSRQVFKSPKQKSLLRYAFEDQKSFDEFSKFMNAIDEQTKTAKNIVRGSPTAERLATSENAAQLGQLAQTYATRGMSGVALDMLRQGAGRMKGISGETSAELQKRLFEVAPVEQRAILEELRKRTQSTLTGIVPTAAAAGSFAGLLGQ